MIGACALALAILVAFSPTLPAQIRAGLVDLTTMVTGVLPVANGGTALASGTSGGVLGYTGSGTLASSGALTASRLVLGGGAGATPTVLGSLGTTTTLLHGNAAGAPTFAAVDLTADVTGTLPVGNGGTGITSLGSGVATWLGTPSVINLNAALTGQKVPQIICNSGTATGTTNSATEVNLAVCTIPAGIIGTNGHLDISILGKFTGTANTKTIYARLSTTSGDTSVGMLVASSTSASASLSMRGEGTVWNANSASAQIAHPAANNFVVSGVSTTTPATGSINTANTSYLNLNGSTVNSGDTCGLLGYSVTLYPGN